MALNTDPNFPPGGPAPYLIDREWCLGDSLTYINLNSANFDSRLENKFDKTGGTITGSLTATNNIRASGTIFATGTITTNSSLAAAGQVSGSSLSTAGTIYAGNKITGNSIDSVGTVYTLAGFTSQNGTSYFDNDAVRLGRESGYNSSGAIALKSNWNNTLYYLAGYQWNDSYFTSSQRNGITTNGDFRVPGVLNAANITAGNLWAGAKSFMLDHPVKEGYKLVHFCVESPNTDLLYRGKATLKNGQAIIDIDRESNMTQGTVNALGTNFVVTSLQNQTGFSRLKPTPVVNGQFTIICEDSTSTDEVSWVVMGERKDLLEKKIEIQS